MMLFSIDQILNRKSHVGISIGIFVYFNLFKQLLTDKTLLGQKQIN